MWKPNESLDDYNVAPSPSVAATPPRARSLRKTGEIEVLEPLTPQAKRAKRMRTTFKISRRQQPLWFRRFLAAGSVALVMIALVLVSAILVGINDPVVGTDVVRNVAQEDVFPQPQELYDLDIYTAPTTDEIDIDIVRTNIRRRTARPRVHFAAKKLRFRSRPVLPQPEQPKFVPTTLVIYAENGVINTRIEPWIQTGDKKTPTYSN